jgi:hypothetical protein
MTAFGRSFFVMSWTLVGLTSANVEKKLNRSSDDRAGTWVYHRFAAMCILHIGENERQVQSALWSPLARRAVERSVSKADPSLPGAVFADAFVLQ